MLRNVDIVVLTALDLEYDAVRAHLTGIQAYTDRHGTRYEIGLPRTGAGRVAIVLIGEGNLAAAALTGHAIEEFVPRALLLVGVAGSVNQDAALGDVVVATRTHAYHGGREGVDGFRARPRSWTIPHALEQTAREIARSRTWIGADTDSAPTVHFKPIVSGEVVLDSRTSPLAALIAHHYGDAVAVDMESAGVAEAAHRKDYRHVVTVRGISDAADGHKRESDRAGWQHRAAHNAAAFAMTLAQQVIDRGPPALAKAARRWPRLTPALIGGAIVLPLLVIVTTLYDVLPRAGGPQVSGWTQLRAADNVTLLAHQTLDLDTGAIGIFDTTWAGSGNVPGMDIGLEDGAKSLRAVHDQSQVALLESSGTHDPNRCTDKSVRYDYAVNNDAYTLVRGRDICVAIAGHRVALLTVDVAADAARSSLTFHYTLWQRPEPDTEPDAAVNSAAIAPAPSGEWTLVTSGSHTLNDYRTVDLDTGASGDFDITFAGTGNLPGMDLGLWSRGTELQAIREPIKIALLDTTGEPNPQRCLNPKLRYTETIFNQNYTLTRGRQLCVGIDDRRLGLITIDIGADPVRPSLTFHYTLWQRAPG